MFFATKIVIVALIVAFASWLSGKKPELAGFITALPLVSILALAFSYIEHKDIDVTSTYAKSIILAVPVSWLFFLPFFFTDKFGSNFWNYYMLGLMLLGGGYFVHQWVAKTYL